MHTRTTPHRRAFTLVELIVVLAIVAALLAVLLPGLRSARESARSGRCLSNARQIAQLSGAFRADHPKDFPCGFGDLDLPETFICPSDPNRGPGVNSYAWCAAPMMSYLNTYNAIDVWNPATIKLASDGFLYRHFLRAGEETTATYTEQWERSTRNKSYLDGHAAPMIGPGSFALDHTS